MKTELATLENLVPAEVFKEGGIDPILEAIKGEVSSTVADVTTSKGRKEIASQAYKVSQSKSVLDKMGKKLADDLNAKLKPINAERRKAKDFLDALKDEIRQPLNEWEAAEEGRKQNHRFNIDIMKSLQQSSDAQGSIYDAAQLRSNLDALEATPMGEQWEEFAAEAAKIKDECITKLKTNITDREKYEADQAELERHRREQAEREQREYEDRIASEAAETAAREERERIELEQQEEQDRIEREREAEKQRVADAEREAEEAEQRRINEQEAAERAATEAAEKAEHDKKVAVQAERDRQADEQRRERDETALREKNRAHKGKINREALAAFTKGGLAGDQAKLAVELIAKKMIANVTINY